jgi:hypothetical protein
LVAAALFALGNHALAVASHFFVFGPEGEAIALGRGLRI